MHICAVYFNLSVTRENYTKYLDISDTSVSNAVNELPVSVERLWSLFNI